jgi:3-deoxy-7-phosphoheptulonate synthase
VLVDVHSHPEQARCDGPQALDGSALRELAAAVRRLPAALGRTDAASLVRSS